MELFLPFSFSDFPEDVQIRILSFLHPSDLDSFARTSARFLALCRDDERLWFLKCSRQWGSHTQIQKWGGRNISYRHLNHFLERYENLIGFWNVDFGPNTPPVSSPSLVSFEWASFYITGYRISPSKSGGYGVMKKPFLWITATSNGKALNYLDTNGSVSLTETDLLREDSEKLRGELILANIELSENCWLSLWEDSQFFEFRRRLSTRKGRAEYESVYRSSPDGLMTQIHEIRIGKLSVTTGDTISKRAKRRERRREREKWQLVRRWDSLHFQKIMDCSPTPSRPLQGLWKGICPNRSLNLYLVYYRECWDQILCEIVGGSSILASYRNFVFGASCTAFTESPYSPEEELMYNSRVHLQSRHVEANQARHNHATSSDDHDVLRIFYADSSSNSNPSYLSGNPDDADGRIWLYANETFGFGFLRDDCIIDLKPMIKNDRLLDLMM